MSILSPLALLGAAVIGPLIIAIYLLKLRREERTISSTFLWRRVVRDVEANTPWQRLRRNLLLLLQLLLMLLLVVALARPFMTTQGISSGNLIMVIDRSASMGATDETPDRLGAAKQRALQLIDQLPDGGRATIIAIGGLMQVPVAATSDRRELRQAIEQIQLTTSGSSDLTQALTLASALAARESESEVAIISDGNVSLPSDLRLPARVSYFPVGRSGENVAISAISLQPEVSSQNLFVQVTNYGAQPVSRRLDLYLDGAVFNAYTLNLEPGREQSIIAEVPAQVQIAEAHLAGSDILPTDDRAFAVTTLGEAATVRLLSPGNRFLEVGLGLLPGIRLLVAPATTNSFTETVAQVPVTILDGVVPEPLPPGNLFFINPPRSTDYFSVTGEIEFPSVRPATGEEPLLRNVSMSDVSILKAVRIVPGSWAQIVVDSDGGPLLIAGERAGRRLAVMTFDLHNSDLPLQIAFPLLLSNLMNFLAPGVGNEAAQLRPGEPLSVQVDSQISEVRVTRPDGSRWSSRAEQLQGDQVIYAETEALGIYTVEEFGDGELLARRHYAANLFAPEESRLLPKDDLRIAQSSGLQSTLVREREGRQEFWRWVAMVALIVLVAEWLVYQRHGLHYLWSRWRSRRSVGSS